MTDISEGVKMTGLKFIENSCYAQIGVMGHFSVSNQLYLFFFLNLSIRFFLKMYLITGINEWQ